MEAPFKLLGANFFSFGLLGQKDQRDILSSNTCICRRVVMLTAVQIWSTFIKILEAGGKAISLSMDLVDMVMHL